MTNKMLCSWLKKLVVVAAAVVMLPRPAGAHGYLADPAARNVQRNSDSCPACLNAGGSQVSGISRRFGMCGDPWNGVKRHEAFGKLAHPPRIARTYHQGQVISVRVDLTANHMGRWSLRLCPLPGSASPSVERRYLSQRCFDRHLLRRADGAGPYTYVPSSANRLHASYRLPPAIACKRCVVQWKYETGNSCSPRGIPAAYTGHMLGTCGSRSAPAGEVFVNCADVRIVKKT